MRTLIAALMVCGVAAGYAQEEDATFEVAVEIEVEAEAPSVEVAVEVETEQAE